MMDEGIGTMNIESSKKHAMNKKECNFLPFSQAVSYNCFQITFSYICHLQVYISFSSYA